MATTWNSYVAVIREYGTMMFVTGFPDRNKAEWKPGEKALAMSEGYAKQVALGLEFNGFPAVVVRSPKGNMFWNTDEESLNKIKHIPFMD